MSTESNRSSATDLTRREAIRRASLLMGIAFLPSLVTRVLHAQEKGMPGPPQSARLSHGEMETLTAMVERIIPRTDTPGAVDVAVPEFINLMCIGYMTTEEHDSLVTGLADVENESRKTHSRAFSRLAAPEQDALLTAIATDARDERRRFFRLVREMTVLGYFTSEAVGKNVLHYDPVPGAFEACAPISEVGNRNWTL